METYLPAVCYFPTTVLLIDDDRDFLDGIQADLDHQQACFRTFDDPKKALTFLTHEYPLNHFTNRCILNSTSGHPDHHTLGIDVRAIHRETSNPQRFAAISVVVIDHVMPSCTGLEICEQLKNHPCKKLLLTAQADETLAIRAFNESTIHKFVRKDAADFRGVINLAIHDLQKQYFHDLSRTIVNALIADPIQPATFFTNQIFIKQFDEIAAQARMAEFYLMDSAGNFMFLDIHGKVTGHYSPVTNSKTYNIGDISSFVEYCKKKV